MAVAIMAVLAVVGFGFASSMKLEHTATRALRNLSQARMGAHAALQLFAGALAKDVTSECTATAGPAADHSGEPYFEKEQGGTAAEKTLVKWGNLTVGYGLTKDATDEASKLNLNAHGNVSKWGYTAVLSDGDSLPGANTATDQLYHGVNERFSSYEVSLEEFFYQLHQQTTLWTDSPSTTNARIRSANLARAICLYRYGGKKDADANGEIDYAGDGKPGAAGTDDDGQVPLDLVVYPKGRWVHAQGRACVCNFRFYGDLCTGLRSRRLDDQLGDLEGRLRYPLRSGDRQRRETR